MSYRAFVLLGLALHVACAGQEPRKDSLTILLPDDILSLDPNQEVESFTDAVLFNVYEPLVRLDANLSPRTVLAESWEHPQPERWRFRLRRGVRFHDGTPLSAGLVRDGLKAVQQASQLDASDFLSQVVEIAAPDEGTIDIVTREPRAILANLPVLYVAKRNEKGAFPPLVGTGPYRVRERTPGRRVVLERWEGYWGDAPEFREAVFEPVPDAQARLARLRGGSADIVYEVTPELATRTGRGFRFVHRQGLTLSYLGFNLRRAADNPFQDLRVRRAIHLALDRQQILDRVLRGGGTVATQPVPPHVFGFDPGLPQPAHDPQRARELLVQAGRANGFQVRLDFGRARQAEAALIRDQLREIRVEIELNPMDRSAVYDLAKAGRSELFDVGWNFSSGEASEFYEFCLHTPTERFGFNNYGSYSNPELDAIAEGNGAILNQRQRKAMLQRAAALAMNDLPVLPLYVEDDVYGVREGVGFEPRADGEILLLDVRRK